MRKHSHVVLLGLLLLALPGCAAVPLAVGAAGGLATVKYLGNDAVADYRATLDATYRATLAALPPLGYPTPTTSQIGPTEANIVAGDARIALAQHPNGVTRVAIRIGTFETADHRRRAALIHERIGAALGLLRAAPPAPAPTPAAAPPEPAPAAPPGA